MKHNTKPGTWMIEYFHDSRWIAHHRNAWSLEQAIQELKLWAKVWGRGIMGCVPNLRISNIETEEVIPCCVLV